MTMNEETAKAVVWHRACSVGDVIEDEGFGVRIDGLRIGLYRLSDGSVHAVGDICTHEFAILSEGFVEDGKVECPLHQALFDIRSGKCFGPLAERDLPAYPVRTDGDDVYIGVPGA